MLLNIFQFLFLFVLAFHSGQVYAAKSTPEERVEKKKEQARESVHAQVELARNYYYGLSGFTEDKKEAYFWFNVCLYSTKNVKGFHETLAKMEEIGAQASQEEKKQQYFWMQKLLVAPGVRIVCEDYVQYLNDKISKQDKEIIYSRIKQWEVENPLPELPVLSDEQQRKDFLTYRLALEFNPENYMDWGYDIEGVKKLIAAGADIKKYQGLPLLVSAEKNRPDIIAYLFESGLTFDQATLDEGLMKAAANGHAEAIKKLITFAKYDAHTLNAALMKAAQGNKKEAISVLLTTGIDDRPILGELLVSAISDSDEKAIAQLSARGAQFPSDWKRQAVVLNELISSGNLLMIRKYAELGGNLNFRPEYGRKSPLSTVSEKGTPEAFELLTSLGMKAEGVDAFYAAIEGNNEILIRYLIKWSSKDHTLNREAIVSYAINEGNKSIFEMLVVAGWAVTPQQQAAIDACPFQEKQCNNGRSVFIERPSCTWRICTMSGPQNDLEQPVDHPANAENVEIQRLLNKGNSEERSQAIEVVLAEPQKFNPLTLYALSDALFHKFRDDEGIFWYMAAGMRAAGDRDICKSNKPSYYYDRKIPVSHPFEFYKRREADKIRGAIPKVKAWDEATPYTYNIQWGLQNTECEPLQKHAEIRKKQRDRYVPDHMKDGPTPVEAAMEAKMDDMLALAEKGDVQAQFQLGSCYARPHSCRRPLSEKMMMYDARAQQEKAQEGQSVKHFKGLDLEISDAKNARRWLGMAASRGHEPARLTLARLQKDKPYGEDEKKLVFDEALELFKAGNNEAFFGLIKGSPSSEGPENVIKYAWYKVAEATGSDYPKTRTRSLLERMSDTEKVQAETKAKEYLKKYVPVFGSTKK